MHTLDCACTGPSTVGSSSNTRVKEWKLPQLRFPPKTRFSTSRKCSKALALTGAFALSAPRVPGTASPSHHTSPQRLCPRDATEQGQRREDFAGRASLRPFSHFRRTLTKLTAGARETGSQWCSDSGLQECSADLLTPGTLSGTQSAARAYAEDLPTQADLVTGGVATVEAPSKKEILDLDYLQELIAIQQQGPRNIGFFGTRNMGYLHQQLIEILSYAMIITNNHIYTSGAAGTNAAVIRGALRAERPDLLTVILPQSLSKQPPESQELLQKVSNLVEMPHNDHLPLIEASRMCNLDILMHVQQVICFAFHDSRLLMETCEEAKNMRKIVTLFYLD